MPHCLATRQKCHLGGALADEAEGAGDFPIPFYKLPEMGGVECAGFFWVGGDYVFLHAGDKSGAGSFFEAGFLIGADEKHGWR